MAKPFSVLVSFVQPSLSSSPCKRPCPHRPHAPTKFALPAMMMPMMTPKRPSAEAKISTTRIFTKRVALAASERAALLPTIPTLSLEKVEWVGGGSREGMEGIVGALHGAERRDCMSQTLPWQGTLEGRPGAVPAHRHTPPHTTCMDASKCWSGDCHGPAQPQIPGLLTRRRGWPTP